jgi:hypothetical protein
MMRNLFLAVDALGGGGVMSQIRVALEKGKVSCLNLGKRIPKQDF